MRPADDLTGVVLAGGAGSRLGRAKADLVLEGPGRAGETLLTRTARLLARRLPRVVVLGREHPEFESWTDDEPGAGPVGAVTTALRRAGTACLVLACDLPFLDEATVDRLLAGWRARPLETLLTTFVSPETGREETLVSIYQPGALRYFEPCLAQRLLKIALVVPPEFRHRVSYPPEEALPFFTINHSADLAAARIVAASGRGAG